MSSSDSIHTTVTGPPPYTPTYKIRNIIDGWPSWNYPSLYEVYCTRGYTIPGERHPLIGTFFIMHYVLYVLIYVPSLVVIGSRPLIEHSCYKIMFAMGMLDISLGMFSTLGAGIFSLMGANYCDNTRLLTIVGHMVHSKGKLGASLESSGIYKARSKESFSVMVRHLHDWHSAGV
jgi:hypothetical protein